MKILLTPIGSHGDVHPFIGLGEELARRGHRVIIITNGHFQKLVKRAGLPFIELGTEEDYREAIEDPDLWHSTRGLRVVFNHLLKPMRQLYHLLAEHDEPGETVAVSPVLGIGARIAQERLGIPLATVHLAPASLRSLVQPPALPGVFMPSWAPVWYRRLIYWLGDRIADGVLAGPVNDFRRELGLPPVRRLTADWWNSPDMVLGLFPDWFGPVPPDWPAQTRLAGFPLYDERAVTEVPKELEAFLQAGDPPVVFTPGSAMLHGREFFQAALDACRRLPCRAILLTQYTEHLPPALPDSVCHFRYVPFSRVFPRAAAVVHHGGIGTTAQCLAAGTPQLIMPMGFDQPDNAARAVRLGVGAVLPPRRFSGRQVARKLHALLAPEVRERCREIAARFQGDNAVAGACNLIEELGRRRKGVPVAKVVRTENGG